MADPGLLYPTADILVESPHRAYGLMLSPRYTVHHDFDAIYDQGRVTKIRCYIDRNARVLMGAPTPMILPTEIGAGDYHWGIDATGGNTDAWHSVVDPDTGQNCLLMDDANVDVSGRLTGSWAAAEGDGFFVKIIKGAPAVDAIHDKDHCYVEFDLGYDATASVYYRIIAALGEPFRLIASYDGGATYVQLRYSDNIPDCEAYLEAHDRRLLITVIPVPHRKTLSIYIGNGDADLSYTDANILFPSDTMALNTKNGKCRLTFLPMGFPIAWSLSSGSVDLTFRPRSSPFTRLGPDGEAHAATVSTPSLPAWPAGATASVAVVPDATFPNIISYTISVSATQKGGFPTGYASRSVMLDWVEIEYPPVTYNDTFSIPVRMNVESVVERHVFDVNNLNIARQATLIADNYHGQWSYSSGMRAVSIARGWNGDNELGFVGWLGETIRYTRDPNSRKAMFWAFDRSFPLRRRKCGHLPPMDAWCNFAAQRYLAERGGVTEDWLIYIPDCPTGPNPRGCTHPLLPMGTGTHPRMKPAPTDPIWSQMNRIRALYRQILAFDRFGYLRIVDYDPTLFNFYGWYTPVPAFDGSGAPYLNEIVTSMEVSASVADVRSEITVVGIDPSDWTPLVVHEQNDSVIYDLSSPAFLGFPDEWVEVDSIFTNLAFMQQFADLMIAQTSLPTVSSDHMAYLQHNLHLLDQFGISEPITIGNALMYAQQLIHSYRIGGAATTSITGKAVANLFG